MTTGFQHQNQGFGPILKSAAKPQHVGTQLAKPGLGRLASGEPKSFKPSRLAKD